ncbi:MAG: tetratricopeptide repeat protein [Egibacteraceae bacterium]
MSEPPRARYVGFGVGAYEDPAFGKLPRAVPDVEAIAEVLTPHGYATCVVADPDEEAVRQGLRTHLAKDVLPDGGSLVVVWAGHGGMVSEQTLQLIARDTETGADPWVSADRIASVAARTGASQILLVFDTCHAQAGALPALTVVSRVLADLPPDSPRVWVGVATSALELESARDGVFGARLVRLLREGPRDNELRLRWSAHSQGVRGDDIIDALLKEWDVPGQQPSGYMAGNAWVMLPNPLYDPDAPERVVEHLLLAAQGRAPDEEGVYFTGRTAQLDQIVAWMGTEARGGLLVVTGPAGCGKSAVVGRIVSLSDPTERASLLEAVGAGLAHADPGEGSVHAHAHARGLTAERLAEVLDGQLVRRDVLTHRPGGARNRWQLLGDLQAASACPVIVIDGLDEAGLEAFRIVEDLVRLSSLARVIVTTRDLPSADGETSLVRALAPAELLDLGDEALHAETEADVRGYIAKRLQEAPAVMDRDAIAGVVIGSARGLAEGVFLLARVVTSQLRATPVDTSLPGWEQLVARSFEAAFEHDLRLIPPLRRGDVDLPQAAGELLAALAWAYGAGFPDDVWPVAATALSATGTVYERADVFWVLGQAGRYVVEDGQGGRAAYRLSHQRLVDHLRRVAQPVTGAAGDEERAGRVAERLVGYYSQLLAGGLAPDASAYLWRYVWRHCADGGQAGIGALRRLAAEDSAFAPALAMALNNLGIRYAEVGQRGDAVAPTEEAVSLRREQAADNPAYLPDLAAALNNLGDRYAEVGRRADAVVPTEEAVSLRREQAGDNPAYLPDLAMALNNLGNRYAEVGRRVDAVAPTEEAVGLRRGQAAANPAYLPDLAAALSNLGGCYREVGRRGDAVAPTEQAVSLHRQQAADNPAFLPDLAMALNNLGNRYAEVGRRVDAVAPTEEAVGLYRQQAAGNPAYLPDLAMALNNLGNRYAEMGRDADVEMVWQQTLDALPASAQAFLLLRRAERRPPGDWRAVDDASRALALVPQDDHRLVADCHAVCRQLRALDPAAFDAAWSHHHPGGLPPWLSLDGAHLELTWGWVATDTVAAEQQLLDEHPELLSDVTAVALDEIGLLQGDPAAVDVYRSLLERARRDGIDQAYRLRLASALLSAWINADLDTKRAMLTARRGDLLSGDVAEVLDSWREDDPDDESLIAHEALLTLASAGQHDAAFDALADLDRLPGLLTELARANAEPATLAAAATLALVVDERDGAQACALFHLAIALAIDGQPEQAEQTLEQAYALDAAQLLAWLGLLVELAPHHPQIQASSQALLRLTQAGPGQP